MQAGSIVAALSRSWLTFGSAALPRRVCSWTVRPCCVVVSELRPRLYLREKNLYLKCAALPHVPSWAVAVGVAAYLVVFWFHLVAPRFGAGRGALDTMIHLGGTGVGKGLVSWGNTFIPVTQWRQTLTSGDGMCPSITQFRLLPSRGQFLIEPKEEMRARGLPSPDKADALMLAFLRNTGGVRLHT